MSVSLIMLCLPVCLYVYLFSCGCLTSVNMPSSLLVSPVSRCRVHSQAHGKREYSAKKNTPLLHTKSSWTYTTYVRPHFSARFWKSGHASGAVHSLHSLPYQKRVFLQDDIEMALRVFIGNIMDWHYLQTVQLSLYNKKNANHLQSPHDVNVF